MSDRREILFSLSDSTPVYRGDVLYHPDKEGVGWYCTAEFARDEYTAIVRSPNGAMPTVMIEDLRKSPPPEPERCSKCGQLLP